MLRLGVAVGLAREEEDTVLRMGDGEGLGNSFACVGVEKRLALENVMEEDAARIVYDLDM